MGLVRRPCCPLVVQPCPSLNGVRGWAGSRGHAGCGPCVCSLGGCSGGVGSRVTPRCMCRTQFGMPWSTQCDIAKALTSDRQWTKRAQPIYRISRVAQHTRTGVQYKSSHDKGDSETSFLGHSWFWHFFSAPAAPVTGSKHTDTQAPACGLSALRHTWAMACGSSALGRTWSRR